MVRFIALLASNRESVGCEVHHASAGGGRLIVLTTLGVADYDGLITLTSDLRTFGLQNFQNKKLSMSLSTHEPS